MYQRGNAFLEVNVPPKIIDSDARPLSLWKKARGILGLSLEIPFPSHTTASTGAGLGFSRPAWSLVPGT